MTQSDHANASVSRELAQEAQSEAPNVETLEEILIQVNCWCLHDRGCTIIEEQQKAIAKINRLIVEAKRNTLRDVLNRDIFKNPDPTEGQAKLKQSIEQDILALSNNLSKGKV